MRHKITIPFIATIAFLITGASFAALDRTPFAFDVQQLSGKWAESYNSDLACAPSNLQVRMQFSEDRKRLTILFDRKWKTELGETDRFGANVLSVTARTVVIRYDGEKRLKESGDPVEWELSIVAPGVYRWRETEWPPGKVNTVVGIRCSG